MKVIVFSDAHLHPYRAHSRLDTNGQNIRLVEGIRAVEQVKQYVADHGDTEAALFCGDLLQHRDSMPTEAACMARAALEGWTVPLIGVPGNHDLMYERGFNTLQALWPGSGCVLSEGTRINGPLQVDAVEWTPNADELKRKIEGLAKQPRFGDYRILMLHATIDGTMQGATGKLVPAQSDLKKGDLPQEVYDWIVVGHIHIRQTPVRCKVLVPGSLTQLNFGDAGADRGFTVIDLDKRILHHYPIRTMRFEVIGHEERGTDVEGAHLRVTFPPGYARDKARKRCQQLQEKHGAVTAEPDILPEAKLAPVVAAAKEERSVSDVVDDFMQSVGGDERDKEYGIKLSIGRNIAEEAQHGQPD